MNERRKERLIPGTVASPGLALGPLYSLRKAIVAARSVGAPDHELQQLKTAVARASAELEALIAVSDQMAADILTFQQALLEDDDLLAPIFAEVARGVAADRAWHQALSREVADYAGAEDEYFRARSADLADLRDRVLRALMPSAERPQPPAGCILLADDLTPSQFLELDLGQVQGAALRGGAASSHVSMLARARAVPLLIGLTGAEASLEDGLEVVLDAEAGGLVLQPDERTKAQFAQRLVALQQRRTLEATYLPRPAITASGEAVAVMINVDDPASLDRHNIEHCDGIGLTRTEFLFRADAPLPDEETQYQVYRRLLAWAAGKEVIIRTLDAGGDKPIPGLTPEGEENAFLGLRGLRLSLQKPEVFLVQLRALVRVAALGPLKVMVPMVTHPDELQAAHSLLQRALAEVKAAGHAAQRPLLGMMVEVPAAALTAEDFPADFYSIGSNDLVQYTTAASRDNAAVANLYQPRHRAIAMLIERVVAAGRARGVDVGLCGEMASEPELVPLLLDLGLRRLSASPGRLAAVKAAVAGWPHG